MTKEGKNLQLLGQASAPWQQPDILAEIADLQAEIAKGKVVYSADELRYLVRKLADREDVLRVLTAGG